MAGYSLSPQEFARGKAGGRFGHHRFDSWGISDDGVQSWSSGLWLSKLDNRVDHVCRPVVIGSDGKATPPSVLYCPPNRHHTDGEMTTKTGGVPGSVFGRQKAAGGYNSYEDEASHGLPSNAGWTMAPEVAGPIFNTSGRWAGPSSTGWRMPHDAPLPGEVKSGAGIATEFLKAKTNKMGGPAVGAVPKIDSSEAAKKYGGKFFW